jgi:hypothetical protein
MLYLAGEALYLFTSSVGEVGLGNGGTDLVTFTAPRVSRCRLYSRASPTLR